MALGRKKGPTPALGCGLDGGETSSSTGVAGVPPHPQCLPPLPPAPCPQENALALLVASELVGGGCGLPVLRARTAGRRGGQARLSVQQRSPIESYFRRWLRGEAEGHHPAPGWLAVCLLHALEEATEELVPEEHEAGGEGRLQQAGAQALEEARHALLPQHLPGAVQEALVASHLGRGRLPRVSGEGITARMWLYPFVNTTPSTS